MYSKRAAPMVRPVHPFLSGHNHTPLMQLLSYIRGESVVRYYWFRSIIENTFLVHPVPHRKLLITR